MVLPMARVSEDKGSDNANDHQTANHDTNHDPLRQTASTVRFGDG